MKHSNKGSVLRMRWPLRYHLPNFLKPRRQSGVAKPPRGNPPMLGGRGEPRAAPEGRCPEPGITSLSRSPAAPAVRTGPERPRGRQAGEHTSGQAAGRQRAPSALAPAAAAEEAAPRSPALSARPAPPLAALGPRGRPALREGRGRSAQPRGAGERGRTAPAPPAPASQRPSAFPPRTPHLGPGLRGLRRRLLLLHAFPASGTGQPFPGAGCSGGDRVTAAVALKGPSRRRHLPPGSARRLRGAAASPDPPRARPALRPPPPLRSRPREGPR